MKVSDKYYQAMRKKVSMTKDMELVRQPTQCFGYPVTKSVGSVKICTDQSVLQKVQKAVSRILKDTKSLSVMSKT